jgi:peptide subunit release factor 1 (eRF1)
VGEALAASAAASSTGGALFVTDRERLLVLPPFPIEKALAVERIDTGPLVELLARPRTVAAVLLRRGGYTMGVFRGDYLVASKTDRRFVKGRHRKGGQSQRRYDRTREKQIHELFGMACEDLRATFAPYEREIEHLFLGGDRLALIAFRKQCDYLDRAFTGRIMARRLQIPGDPRRASLDAVPAEVWSSDVLVAVRPDTDER